MYRIEKIIENKKEGIFSEEDQKAYKELSHTSRCIIIIKLDEFDNIIDIDGNGIKKEY
jgi:hypothetical protein